MKKVPLSGGSPHPPPPQGKTLREILFSLNVCEAVLQGTLQAASPFKRREFLRETHTSLRLLIRRIIILTHEKTSFAILIGRIVFFFAFRTKKLLKWKGLVFHCCLYNQHNITYGPLEIQNFSSRVEKIYFSQSLGSLVKYFSKLEEKFSISASPCNNPYLRHILLRWVFLSTYIINWRASYTYCSVRGQKSALYVWG